MAVVFAFCCLVFAACNDLVFKVFTRKQRSKGSFISLIGITWLLALVWLPRSPESNPLMTVLWGCISGVFSVSSNILLMEAMERQSAGVCSSIYRLIMILVVLGATLFLGETLSILQWTGILLAVLAVLAFLPGKQDAGAADGVRKTGFYLVLAAAVLRAGMGLSYKYGFLQDADRNGVTLINSLFWIGGGILYALLRERQLHLPGRKLLLYGVFSGLLVAGIVFFMAASLHLGNAGIVLPIAQMSFLGTLLLSVLILKERIDVMKIAAVLCGAGAILLLING